VSANESAQSEFSEYEIDASTDKTKLRKVLADLALTPEQTSDDLTPTISRDSELLEEVPPHHA